MAVDARWQPLRASRKPPAERGAALVTALVLLLVLTILTLSGSRTALLETRMSNNLAFRQQAREAAEYALRVAEAQIEAAVNSPASLDFFDRDGSADIAGFGSPVLRPGLSDLTFDVTDRRAWAAATTVSITSPVSANYVVEYMGRVGLPPADSKDADRREYALRITALGRGLDQSATYLLQSSFSLPL